MEEPIRIISDLHLGHTASLARAIEQIEPLYAGVRTVILNGDTVEMRSEQNRERARHIMTEVSAFCAAQSAFTHFINGNHDPIISTTNHLEIDDGTVLVTHGDVLLRENHDPDDGLPGRGRWRKSWCGPADALEDREIEDLSPPEREHLAAILSTNKRVSHDVDLDSFTIPNGHWGQFSTFMRQTWPPNRLVRMVSGWRRNTQNAFDLVRVYRPEARCMVVGHTHKPGIWHRHGYTVVNTGSFLPMLGRLAVDYARGVVTVRRVVFRRRKFHLGPQIARFPVNGRFLKAS